MLVRHMLVTALMLGLFAVVGTTIVALTEDNTRERIAWNEREYLLRSLNEVVPRELYDNDIETDTIEVSDRMQLGSRKPVTVHLARKEGRPVAAIFTTIAPDGYSGEIRLLVAVDHDSEQILGVRVVAHRETPGLGDAIEIEKSSWIKDFSGHSLSDPGELGWNVEKDGGIFDQFTGATITPRAVVRAVHNTLKYYARHKHDLFPAGDEDESGNATDGAE
jgi:Na+-translocating ferredoxin:NAD+ oxidoreductase subunit G